MEFGFKETKTGYAKAEVDAVVMNLQHTIEELQLKDIGLDQKWKEINVKTDEIHKNALITAKKIIKKANNSYSSLDNEGFKAFKGLVSIKLKINQFVQSKVSKVSDDEIDSLTLIIEEAENDLDLNIKFLRSMIIS